MVFDFNLAPTVQVYRSLNGVHACTGTCMYRYMYVQVHACTGTCMLAVTVYNCTNIICHSQCQEESVKLLSDNEVMAVENTSLRQVLLCM